MRRCAAAKNVFTDDEEDDSLFGGSNPPSPKDAPSISFQDSEADEEPVRYSSDMKNRPPRYRPAKKFSEDEDSPISQVARYQEYPITRAKCYSSDDSISTISADRGSVRQRLTTGHSSRGKPSPGCSRDEASGGESPQCGGENVTDIYAELQMINDKMKREFKILHERDKVLKERERVLTDAESAVAAAKASLEMTVELEVKRRINAKEEERKAEVESVEQVLREKSKENKRLKENFDTLKVANEALRKELEVMGSVHGKMEKQATSLQARLTNLQRKAEHDQRKDVDKEFLPPELMRSKKQKEAHKMKPQPTKGNTGSYDVLAILLEWISDVHLRHMVTDQPTKPLDMLCSSQAVQEKCLKVLPSLAEIIKEVPTTYPALVVPCLQFIYWSLLHLDAIQGQTGGAAKMNLSSTLRRLGEELYKSRLVRFAEDDTGTVQPPGEKARDKEGQFFRSPNLHIRLLSSLIILRSLNQVDHLAAVFEVLKADLKNDTAKQLFLHYQATSIIIPYLRPTNKALLQAAVDVHLGMSMESPVLTAFLEACSTELWFRAIAMVMRMPNVDEKIIEKLSILLQKLSKLKSNRRYFEVFGLTLATQELHRAAAGSNNAFLTLNLKSILFNLNAKSTITNAS